MAAKILIVVTVGWFIAFVFKGLDRILIRYK